MIFQGNSIGWKCEIQIGEADERLPRATASVRFPGSVEEISALLFHSIVLLLLV
jgi:hypothetical protein